MNKSKSYSIAVIIVAFFLIFGAVSLFGAVEKWVEGEPATTTKAPSNTTKAPTTSTTPTTTTTAPVTTTTAPVTTTTAPVTTVCPPHDYTSEVTKTPTCSDMTGERTYTCVNCAHSYVEEFTQEIRHMEGNYTVTKEATCTTAGTKESYCVNCGDHMRTLEIPALGHDYLPEYCKSALNYGNHIKSYVCSRCDYEAYSETISCNFVNGVCSDCGLEECTHSSSYYIYDNVTDNTHIEKSYCNDCGFVLGWTEEEHSCVNGVCSDCGYGTECSHDYNAGTGKCDVCAYVCTHHYENGESSVLKICVSLNNGKHEESYDCAICGYTLYHNDYSCNFDGDDICDDCGYECTHDYDVNTGYCNVCDMPCEHVWGEGNNCIYCGYLGG